MTCRQWAETDIPPQLGLPPSVVSMFANQPALLRWSPRYKGPRTTGEHGRYYLGTKSINKFPQPPTEQVLQAPHELETA